jgi:hypothetical protein
MIKKHAERRVLSNEPNLVKIDCLEHDVQDYKTSNDSLKNACDEVHKRFYINNIKN